MIYKGLILLSCSHAVALWAFLPIPSKRWIKDYVKAVRLDTELFTINHRPRLSIFSSFMQVRALVEQVVASLGLFGWGGVIIMILVFLLLALLLSIRLKLITQRGKDRMRKQQNELPL